MKYLFNEYGDSLISALSSCLIVTLFVVIILGSVLSASVQTIEAQNKEAIMIEEKLPVSIDKFICGDALVNKDENFIYQKYIKASNSKGEDISNFVRLYQEVDTSVAGETEAVYVLRYNGEKRLGKAKVFVINESDD